MKKVAKPVETVADVVDMCVNPTRRKALCMRLLGEKENLIAQETAYDQSANIGNLYTMSRSASSVGALSKDDLEYAYTTRFTQKGGRLLYEKLQSAPAHGRCPLCSHRQVATLDHYLPKAEQPAFAITPANLVPSCTDCNKSKLTFQSTVRDEQLVHPYYDDPDSLEWLCATVVETIPPAVTFKVDQAVATQSSLGRRIAHHFDKLHLEALYTVEASAELASKAYRLRHLYNDAGASAVAEYLHEEAAGLREFARNSWKAAMYHALAECEWFHNVGCLNLA